MQSPFISKRNAKRVARSQVEKYADKINTVVCEGNRVVKITIGLVDALTQVFNEAGGWKAVVDSRDETEGAVHLTHDPQSPRKSDANPFYPYEEVRRRSSEYVTKAAVPINEGLRDGQRVFQYPIGIAADIVESLNGLIDGEPSGWKARLGESNKNVAVIIVAEDEEPEAMGATEDNHEAILKEVAVMREEPAPRLAIPEARA